MSKRLRRGWRESDEATVEPSEEEEAREWSEKEMVEPSEEAVVAGSRLNVRAVTGSKPRSRHGSSGARCHEEEDDDRSLGS